MRQAGRFDNRPERRVIGADAVDPRGLHIALPAPGVAKAGAGRIGAEVAALVEWRVGGDEVDGIVGDGAQRGQIVAGEEEAIFHGAAGLIHGCQIVASMKRSPSPSGRSLM